ncbi:MAG: ABC transporter permease [Treponema sp.]|nr:ABC transporter permease [Treponema sp.]
MSYIAKRLLVGLITLILVSVLCFLAFLIIPGDAALLALGTEATQEQIEALQEELGLNMSLPAQYFSWLGRFLRGDQGYAARFRGATITGLILERLPVTITLALLSFSFMLLIAVPVSLFAARREHSLAGRIITTLTALNISVPGFFLGILFIWVFGLIFRLFVPGAYIDYRDDVFGFISYMIFPALAIALPNAAFLIKFLRSAIQREFNSDYARTARSKGGSRPYILKNHVFKNASIPGITLLGMIIGDILSGSLVIEQVFSIPGLGRLLITSINSRDFPMIGTLMMYVAFIVIMANTAADIALQMVDPRIRLEKRV